MPRTEVVFYQEAPGHAPVLEWLDELRHRDKRAYAKCWVRIELLAQMGHELRRPLADTLRDGIHELRIRHGHVNYRILYFFHGRNVAVLSHALTKEDKVPEAAIALALRRKRAFKHDPEAHSYHEEDTNNG